MDVVNHFALDCFAQMCGNEVLREVFLECLRAFVEWAVGRSEPSFLKEDMQILWRKSALHFHTFEDGSEDLPKVLKSSIEIRS